MRYNSRFLKAHMTAQTPTSKNPLFSLVGHAPADALIGYAYQVQYGEASLLVNDKWKARVSGVPLNAFLVATSMRLDQPIDKTPHAEREVLLLRVISEFELPTDKDLVKTLIERHKNRTSSDIENASDGLDVITLGDLQWGGLRCRILGTFYINKADELAFGSDLENFPSASNLRVYKPMGGALEVIVNYCDPLRKRRMLADAQRLGFHSAPPDVDVGTVRYTSTQRLHEQASQGPVAVRINSGDFLARRTACFGMTRTGKSNLIKTLVASVRLASAAGGVPIGQLIFDLNGEYANANHQDDGSSIADVFREDTIRYRGLETRGFRDLRNNFYTALGPGLTTLQTLLDQDKLNSSADIRNFIEMSLDEPDINEHAEHRRWMLRRAVYLAMLHKAGYVAPKDFKLKFQVAKETMEQIKLHFRPNAKEEGDADSGLDLAELELPEMFLPEWWKDPAEGDGLTLDEAVDWFQAARSADQKSRSKEHGGLQNSQGRPWLDGVTRSLLNLLSQRSDNDSYIRGMKVFTRFAQYHSPRGSADAAADIYHELERGKIVILDLSVGIPSIRQDMAERIAKRLFEFSMGKFTEGGDPPQMVMYVEEAHNLIGKNAELDKTWPRIAKEGAKFKIALVYATQEPSSVHPNILANTENWFITHLNNDDEINAIGKFYDFADFGKSLKKAQDIGFARIKTLSASFVVPTQVKLFDPAAVRASMAPFLTPNASKLPKPVKALPSLESQQMPSSDTTESMLRALDSMGDA
jgi:Helicase HerA, central domain